MPRVAPDSPEAFLALGLLRVRQGHRDEAVALLRRASSLRPDSTRFAYACVRSPGDADALAPDGRAIQALRADAAGSVPALSVRATGGFRQSPDQRSRLILGSRVWRTSRAENACADGRSPLKALMVTATIGWDPCPLLVVDG
jgi:hypothetical protein